MKFALDLGNVLAHIDFTHFIEKGIEFKCFKNEKEGFHFINYCTPLMDVGSLSIIDALKFNYKLTEEKLAIMLDFWLRSVYANDDMFIFLEKLIIQGHKIAILSNLGVEHVAMVRNVFPDVINKCVQHFSCEVGVKKPSKLFFKTFLDENIDFKSATFIDDRNENLLTAKKFHFKTNQFRLDEWDSSEEAVIAFRESLQNAI